jgi:phosphatidate cytidylyltransferase
MTSLPPAEARKSSNTVLRVASAAVLIPAALLALVAGHWVFLAMIGAGVFLLAREWCGMSTPRGARRLAWVMTIGILAVAVAAYADLIVVAWVLLVVSAGLAALVAGLVGERPGDAAYGVIYIAPAILALVWLRGRDHGLEWALMTFLITWASDSAAYAVGRLARGPKLAPQLSPNKTWSGFVGGLAGAIVPPVGLVFLLPATLGAGPLHLSLGTINLTWWGAAVVGLVGGLATMMGDLWESFLKRRFGVKDSGDLIPGHGGLLDRVDGLLFTVVVVAVAYLLHDFGLTHLWGLSS